MLARERRSFQAVDRATDVAGEAVRRRRKTIAHNRPSPHLVQNFPDNLLSGTAAEALQMKAAYCPPEAAPEAVTETCILQGQFRLLPEGGDERRAATHATKGSATKRAELDEIPGAEVGQLVLLPVAPEVLHRIELGSIGR